MPADRAAMKRAFASPQSTTEVGEKKTRRISPTGLRFSHVTYRYTPTSRIVLRDFSFYFAPGTVTAILGETGVGKTTLVRLLLSLVRPVGGSMDFVLEDGSTMAVMAEHRNLFAYVPQGNSLLSGTIRDNLLLADPQATEEQMRTVLEVAGADLFCVAPRNRHDVYRARWWLSEGQAQRI